MPSVCSPEAILHSRGSTGIARGCWRSVCCYFYIRGFSNLSYWRSMVISITPYRLKICCYSEGVSGGCGLEHLKGYFVRLPLRVRHVEDRHNFSYQIQSPNSCRSSYSVLCRSNYNGTRSTELSDCVLLSIPLSRVAAVVTNVVTLLCNSGIRMVLHQSMS